MGWLRRCADWLAQLDAGGYPPAVNLRPACDWPDTAHVAVDLARVRAVLHRIAADLDELARARRVADLNTAATLPDRNAEVRRRLAEPDLDFGVFCSARGLPSSSTLQLGGSGTPGKTRSAGAARLTSGLDTPTTRSGLADLRGHRVGVV